MTSPKLSSRSMKENPSQQSPPWERFSPRSAASKQRDRPFWSGVRFKATFLAVTVGVLPILAISTAGYFFADRSIRKQVEIRKKIDAEFLANDINRFMYERYDDIQTLAKQSILVNSDLRARTLAAEEERFLNDYLETYKEIYNSVAFLDIDGNDIAITGGLIHENHWDEDYFQAALGGTPFISKPRFSDAAGQFVIYLAAPVKDRDTDEIVGVVRTQMPVETI